MKTYKSSGIRFNIVNDLPTQIKNRLLKSVDEFLMNGSNFLYIDKLLKYIAGGVCGRVYDLGEGYILKVNKSDNLVSTPDGDILKDLQGVDFIPKVYWYSQDNRFIVVQKIDGVTTGSYHGDFLFKQTWKQKEFEKRVHKAVNDMQARGWFPNDIHGGNCMIDKQGNFWIVDVGLFKDLSKSKKLGSGLSDLLWQGKRVGETHNDIFSRSKASRGVA